LIGKSENRKNNQNKTVMRKIKLNLLLSIVSLYLISCATASITSNKSENLSGPYKKFFILISSSSRAKSFIDGFVENLKIEFAVRNTDLEVYVKQELALETEKDINDKINASTADAILIINQTESMIYGGVGLGSATGSNSGTFDLRLFDKTPDNLVWRAQMKAYGDYGISMAIDKATYNLLKKLEQDNIIIKKP
jgi:hypothetical protein